MADSVGNTLGPRSTFVYESDAGVSYNIRLDESVGTAVGNAASTNAALPILCPSRFLEPRYVLMQQTSDASIRKRAIIGDPANSLFASTAASTVTINSVEFTITGRVGQKSSTLPVASV